MNVGDYVRTDTGIIEKLEGIHEQNKTNETIIKLNRMGGGRYAHILDINSEFADTFDKNFSRGNIIKSSPNIIDLIQVGDYVNGYMVGNIDNCKGCMRQFYYDDENPNDDVGHWEEEIENIVTKEQFVSMEYKVRD